MLEPEVFFDLKGQDAAPLFERIDHVWEVLPSITRYIEHNIRPNVAGFRSFGDTLSKTCVLWEGQIFTDDIELEHGDATKGLFKAYFKGKYLEEAAVVYAGAALLDGHIEIGPGVVIEPGALIKGPTIIRDRSEIRQGAYIRGGCLVGRRCVVGHTTEMKNTVMLDDAKAAHFAYLGDSILGRNVNLGAGTKLANLKIVPLPISFTVEGAKFKVNFRKFGAILGDGCETGCNSVTSPGTMMGKRCLVSPNQTVPSGFHHAGTIIRPVRHRIKKENNCEA